MVVGSLFGEMAGIHGWRGPGADWFGNQGFEYLDPLNLGLVWMCFATLFPLGILQLYESVSHGYFVARTLQYLSGSTNALLEWFRLPGDMVFIVGGVLPLLYLCWLGVRYRVGRTTLEEPEHPLFTEVAEVA